MRRRKKTSKKSADFHQIGAYVRVSTSEQAENPEGSIKSQEQRLRQFVEYKNAMEHFGEIVHVYIDRAKSAKDQNRLALQQMLADVASGKLSMVCVTELSRLTRSIKDFSEIWDFLEKKNCEFLSLREQFDSTSAAGQMVMFSLANIAQFERSQTSERIKANFLARAKRGLFNGGSVPFGYELDPDRKGYLKIDEPSAKIVREAYRTYLKEGTVSAAGKSLNERGFRLNKKTQCGGKGWRHSHFTHGFLYTMLTNPAYAGKRRYQENGEEKLSKACWEAIIEPQVFSKVQKKLQASYRKNKTTLHKRYPFLLSSMVKCGGCEKAMNGKSAHGNSGKVPYYEHGWLVRKVGLLGSKEKKYPCTPHRVPAKVLEPLVWTEVTKLLSDPDFAVKLHAQAKLLHKSQGPEKERQEILAKMRNIDDKLEALSEHLAQIPKSVSPKPIFKQMEKLEEDKERVQEKLTILKESGALKETPISLKDYKEFLKALQEFAKKSDDAGLKHKVARLLIHKVVVFEENIEIHFNMGTGLKKVFGIGETQSKKDRRKKSYFGDSKTKNGNEKQTKQKQKKAVGAKAPPPFSLPSSRRASACPVEHRDNQKYFLKFGSTTIDFGGIDNDPFEHSKIQVVIGCLGHLSDPVCYAL